MLRQYSFHSSNFRWLLCCSVLVGTWALVEGLLQAPGACPGLQQGVCSAACQLATCIALAGFYSSTLNETRHGLDTRSWTNRYGWDLTKTQSCPQLLAAQDSPPSHCSWYGVTCCTAEALAQQDCGSVYSIVEIKIQVNGVNGSIADPQVIQSIVQLHSCGLTRLNLEGNDLAGTIGSEWGLLTNLTVLNLGNNWLTGTIPDALSSLSKLNVLSLGTNFLSGPVPARLGILSRLQQLRLGANAGSNDDGDMGLNGTIPDSLAELSELELLDLGINAMTGTLPPALCQNMPNLSMIKLRGNQLTGPVDQLLNCTALTQLDISSNNFSGPLPSAANIWDWQRLEALDFSHNSFEGTIPDVLTALPVVGYLNAGHNRLTGTLHRSITLMQYLRHLALDHNQLTGHIDENIWFLPQLSVLDLSHNKLSGTISRVAGLSFGIQQIVLHNNSLVGSLPPNLGLLKDLTLLDIRQNPAMKSCGQGTTSSPTCSAEQLLPCFLKFGDALVPQTDGSNMSCPAILRRPRDEAVHACAGNGSAQLGELADFVTYGSTGLLWIFDLDPSYYSYHRCQCLGGYSDDWQNNGTQLVCVNVKPVSVPAWVPGVVGGAAAAGGMLALAAVLLVWLKLKMQLRPRWQREKELKENRKKGMPSGGPATIVVTDVENYSSMMQTNAQLTTKAMGIHNAILRKAVAAHAGHVVEQEGDSWSVAFHTPMDAVAFCLQVQQALQKTAWPESGSMSIRRRRSSGTAAAASTPAASTAHAHPARALAGASSIKSDRPHRRGSSFDSAPSAVILSPGQVAPIFTELNSPTGAVGCWPATPKAAPMLQETAVTTNGVIRGLRVRMGVATGWVPRSTNIGRCALFELAKMVSDMAHGGQVLMEANTFAVVRNRLTELGTVDHKGYSDKLRAVASKAVMRQQAPGFISFFLCRFGTNTRGGVHETDAIVLDMGEYVLPSLASVISAAAEGCLPAFDMGSPFSTPKPEPAAASKHPGLAGALRVMVAEAISAVTAMPASTAAPQAAPPEAAAPRGVGTLAVDASVSLAASAALGRSAVTDLASQTLQLCCILPRSLRDRQKLWLANLNVKEGTQQTVKGYFDAPGTTAALLISPSVAPEDQPPLLPATTTVFAAVEGGKVLVHKRPEAARVIHNALSRIIHVLLAAIRDSSGQQDGYLWRQQEGELKYLLAFREPAKAVEWALLLQEVIMDVPWPEDVIQALNRRGSWSSVTGSAATPPAATQGRASGRLSIKVGLAEGHPDCIFPDHMGRPDYYGNFVNLAARMMDSAAKGGQVVTSIELAEKIYSAWWSELGPRSFSRLQDSQHSAAEGADSTDLKPGYPSNSLQPVKEGSAAMKGFPVAAIRAVAGMHTSSDDVCGGTMPPAGADLGAGAMPADGPSYPQRLVHISGQHIGTYAFKGCGEVEMISFTADSIAGWCKYSSTGSRGAKGALVLQGTGPVIGLQDCPVMMPDVLPTLQQAWAAAVAAAEAAAEAIRRQRKEIPPPPPAPRYKQLKASLFDSGGLGTIIQSPGGSSPVPEGPK